MDLLQNRFLPCSYPFFCFSCLLPQLFASGGGGCCDCGDPEAWRSNVYCDLHMPTEESEDEVRRLCSVQILRINSQIWTVLGLCLCAVLRQSALCCDFKQWTTLLHCSMCSCLFQSSTSMRTSISMRTGISIEDWYQYEDQYRYEDQYQYWGLVSVWGQVSVWGLVSVWGPVLVSFSTRAI